jgi:AraC-like DNA-binding protein
MKNREIKDIRINSVSYGALSGDFEGITHTKILPTLSIVQAVEGEYEIGIGDGELQKTGEGGLFIAPSSMVQKIVHHNRKNGKMQAHWAFIDATVNDCAKFDEWFCFPVVLSKTQASELSKQLFNLGKAENYFQKIYAVYGILEALANIGELADKPKSERLKIEKFVAERYADDIGAKEIADVLYCSVAQAFRYTKKFFGLTPANYVNGIRLQRAAVLLENSEKSVTEIAFLTGFSDAAYFSKLFKRHYAQSPVEYRKEKNRIKW